MLTCKIFYNKVFKELYENGLKYKRNFICKIFKANAVAQHNYIGFPFIHILQAEY